MAASNTLPPQAAQTPSAATDAVCTLPAIPGQAWTISSILYSYSATPTGGQLVVAWGTSSLTFYVSGGGPGSLILPPLNFPVNTQVVITLKSGAGSVSGSVYPMGYSN